MTVDGGQLADQVAGAADAEDGLRARGAGGDDLGPAVQQDQGEVGRLALLDELGAGGFATGGAGGPQRVLVGVAQRRPERVWPDWVV
jgi:hypothetical protein